MINPMTTFSFTRLLYVDAKVDAQGTLVDQDGVGCKNSIVVGQWRKLGRVQRLCLGGVCEEKLDKQASN